MSIAVGLVLAAVVVVLVAWPFLREPVADDDRIAAQPDERLALGQSMKVDGYTITNRGVRQTTSPQVRRTYALLDVKGRYNGTIRPAQANYTTPPEPAQEVSITTNWQRAQDFYVIADELHPKTQLVYVKVLVKPLVNLIWVAGIVFLLGAGIALWPDAREQRRLVTRLAPAQA